MRLRVLIWGSLAVALVAAVIAWRCADIVDQQTNVLRRRLWLEPGCDRLAVAAIQARDAADSRGRFPPWQNWPRALQQQACGGGLEVLGTEMIDGLCITSFGKHNDLKTRFYYVVPQDMGPEGPWFRVIAVAPDACLYTQWPAGTWPVVERLRGATQALVDVVRRICHQRNGKPGR